MSKKKKKEKTLLDVVKEVDAKERKEALAEEARKQEEKLEREKEQKKAYEEKIKQEKIELIKLKSGVISEDDIPKEKTEEKHYTVFQKIGNFFYHNKAYIIFGACAAAMFIWLAYGIITADRPDMTVMFIADDPNMEYLCSDAAEVLEPYCEDVNGDGEIMLKMYYVPEKLDDENNPAAMQLNQSNRTKLVAEFQAGEVIMIIGTKEIYEEMGILSYDILQDMTEIYPDDEYADECGYLLSGTTLGEKMDYDGLSNDLYISFRLPRKLVGTNVEAMTKNYETALRTFDRYIAENRKNTENP